MAGTGRMEGDRTSIREETEAGRGWEERLHPGQAKPAKTGVGALGRRPVPSVLCSICLSTGAHPAFHSIGLAGLLPAWLLKYVWGRRVVEKTAPGINNPAQPPETRTLRTPG